jgi:hypothetical protein
MILKPMILKPQMDADKRDESNNYLCASIVDLWFLIFYE